MIEYKTEKQIAEISSTGSTAKRLTLTSWNNAPAKLDLRVWRTAEDGTERPGKGVTLTEAEAQTLAAALQEYLAEK